MSNWEDTVMSDEQLEQIEDDYFDEALSVNVIRVGRGYTEDLKLRTAQAQARLSFPAGEKQGYNKGFWAGMREVMAVIRRWQKIEIIPPNEEPGEAFYSKLKEWANKGGES